MLVVPEDPNGTISVQQLVAKAAPKTNTDDEPKPAPKPKPKRTLSTEEQAAMLLEGKDPSDFETDDNDEQPAAEPDTNATVVKNTPKPAPKPAPKAAPKPAPKPAVDPNVTGDFTQTDEDETPAKTAPKPTPKKATPAKTIAAAPEVDPNVTGDFTQAGDSPVPPKKSAPATTKKIDPNVTGEFTQTNEGEEHSSPGEVTGEFTNVREKPPANEPKENFDKTAVGRVKTPQVNVTRKAGDPVEEEEEDDSIPEDIPPKLGGYEVLKVLGRGGMGAVLLGRQVSLDRKVAIKVMHPKIAQSPSFVARFTREAYAAAQLTHHNVIQIYDIGEDKGQHFFSMEFVQGQSLMDLVKKEGKLAADVAVGYILQAARGLRYGHNQGMVHRDIKPDNLMLNSEGIVKVADLGLVKLPGGELPEQAGALPASEDDEPGSTNLTRAGAVMGTPAYMSPEQSTDSATVDARADIYSLGCTLYVLLTGRPPFEGRTALEIISKHQTEPIVPPEVVVKRVPKAISAILLKMMAKKPSDRYQSMDEVITALESFLGLERAGTFSPKEEQADQLEKCAHQFHHRSQSGTKRSLVLGFFAVCVLGIVGSAFAGMASLAGGLLGLAMMTPLAYFVVHGTFCNSIVFKKVRSVVFGMRFFDWLMWFGGGLLFLVTLYLFGFLWSWIGFAALAVGLAFLLWFLTDRKAAKAQESPVEEARGLLKSLRLQGLEEDAVRQFVCKFSGQYWEPLYEALFGYEALIAARASRKGDTGEPWKKFGTWREPVVQWADARMEARRHAKERKHLQQVEAKALEAEGVSKAEAKAQAEAMASDMVDQAAEAKQARKEGKEVSVKQMVASARDRRPAPGMTIAGKKHRDLSFKTFVNEWFGRKLRFAFGAAIFAIGLLWLHQNDLLKGDNAYKAITQGNAEALQQATTSTAKAATKPLRIPGDLFAIPANLQPSFNTWAFPLTGFLVLLNGLFYYGWRPTVVTIPAAALAIFGPLFGVPALDPLTAQQLCLIAGAILILIVARFVRH